MSVFVETPMALVGVIGNARSGFLGLGKKERAHAEWKRQQEQEEAREEKKRKAKKAEMEEEEAAQEREARELAHKIRMAKLRKQAAEAGVSLDGEEAPKAKAESKSEGVYYMAVIGNVWVR